MAHHTIGTGPGQTPLVLSDGEVLVSLQEDGPLSGLPVLRVEPRHPELSGPAGRWILDPDLAAEIGWRLLGVVGEPPRLVPAGSTLVIQAESPKAAEVLMRAPWPDVKVIAFSGGTLAAVVAPPTPTWIDGDSLDPEEVAPVVDSCPVFYVPRQAVEGAPTYGELMRHELERFDPVLARLVRPDPKFRAGDIVKHGPSGEEWQLGAVGMWAGVEEVVPLGWPAGIAKASDCTLVDAVGDEEHAAIVRRCLGLRGDHGEIDVRASWNREHSCPACEAAMSALFSPVAGEPCSEHGRYHCSECGQT